MGCAISRNASSIEGKRPRARRRGSVGHCGEPLFASGLPTTHCGEGEAVTDTVVGPRRNYSWTGDTAFTNPLDPVDTVFGIVSPFEVDPKETFRTHANRLKNAGL